MRQTGAVRTIKVTTPTWIAGGLMTVGILLAVSGAGWWFLLLAAAGALGPGLLREFGILNELDEFEQEVHRRAGYHAYLAGTLVAFLLTALSRSEGLTRLADSAITLLLIVPLFTWFLSSLFGYWGTVKAARRILLCFGSLWLTFAILSNTGSEWTGWTAFLLHPLLSAPFFVAATTARRWPVATSVLLMGCAAGFCYLFGIFSDSPIQWLDRMFVVILFIGPLFACGSALLKLHYHLSGKPHRHHSGNSSSVHQESRSGADEADDEDSDSD